MGEVVRRQTKRWGGAFLALAMYVCLTNGPALSQWIDSLSESGFSGVTPEKWVKLFIDQTVIAFATIRAFQSKRWHEAAGPMKPGDSHAPPSTA